METNITSLPTLAGVYLFKDTNETVLYVGKAKNLKNRVASYFKKNNTDVKTKALVESSDSIDHIVTKNDVEAMLLEAQLIRSYQPKFNILLKTGQPYVYILFTHTKLPEIKLVRQKKANGTHFGPFLEKGHARRVYKFLTDTFNIKICNKKIANGCLHYHIGGCAGSCKKDFNLHSYLERLELAKKALQRGHKKFLAYLDEKIKENNKKLNFEKSQELNSYYQAFDTIFASIETHFLHKEKSFSHKHIWILHEDILFLFDESNSTTRKKESFLLKDFDNLPKDYRRYFESYYQKNACPQTIMTNFNIKNRKDYEQFLQKWHKKSYPISICTNPQNEHLKSLVKLAIIHAKQELKKAKTLGISIKKLLKLPGEPHTIDCFDVSHKQGTSMVGSSVRFTNGKPDKNGFRKFKIKTVTQQDDYACLREIVSRRYKDKKDLPDLVLVDGGKGQLNTVQSLFPETEFASLAKKEEIIFSKRLLEGKKLNIKSFAGQSLIALRDYAHHFAISYHKKLNRFSKEYIYEKK